MAPDQNQWISAYNWLVQPFARFKQSNSTLAQSRRGQGRHKHHQSHGRCLAPAGLSLSSSLKAWVLFRFYHQIAIPKPQPVQRNELRSESNSRILEVAREVLLISNNVHIDARSPHTKLYGGSAVSTFQGRNKKSSWVWQDDTWYWTDLFKMNLRSPHFKLLKSRKHIVDHVLADYRQSKSKPSCKKHWQSANDANISLVEPNAQDSLRTGKTLGRTTRWPLFSIFDSDACHHQPPRKSESWMSRGPRQRLPRELGRKLRNDSTVEMLKRRVSTSSVRLKRPCAGLALSSAQAILDMLLVAETSSYTAISH